MKPLASRPLNGKEAQSVAQQARARFLDRLADHLADRWLREATEATPEVSVEERPRQPVVDP